MIVRSPSCGYSSDSDVSLGRVDAWTIFISEPSNGTYIIGLNMPFEGTISSLSVKSQSGSALATVRIDGVVVTGLNAVAMDATERTHTATAANTFSVGQDVSFIVSSNSALANLSVTLTFRRSPIE